MPINNASAIAVRPIFFNSRLLLLILLFDFVWLTPGSAARAMRVPLRPTPRWRSAHLRATAEADVMHPTSDLAACGVLRNL